MAAQKQLAEIGALAVQERMACVQRNATRTALRNWLKNYTDETGVYFDRDDCIDGGMHEDVTAFDSVKGPAVEAQRQLTSVRAKTRRAIARAGLGKTTP